RKKFPAVFALISASVLFAQAHAFSLADVTARAQALAEQPYVQPVSNLSPTFSKMQFGDYIKIQPRSETFEWRNEDTPFKLSFYHQGMQFNVPIRVNEIVDNDVKSVPYDPSHFNFGGLSFDSKETSQLGYAGFRVLYPINHA